MSLTEPLLYLVAPKSNQTLSCQCGALTLWTFFPQLLIGRTRIRTIIKKNNIRDRLKGRGTILGIDWTSQYTTLGSTYLRQNSDTVNTEGYNVGTVVGKEVRRTSRRKYHRNRTALPPLGQPGGRDLRGEEAPAERETDGICAFSLTVLAQIKRNEKRRIGERGLNIWNKEHSS